MHKLKEFKIAISCLLQDAGEATRAIELARGLREECPPHLKLEIVFFSHGSGFDQKIKYEGFSVFDVIPRLPGIGFQHDLKSTSLNMVGDENLAYSLLRGEKSALEEVQPNVFLHGFWPIAGVAAKLVRPPVEISYLPLPFSKEPFSTYLMQDVPDFITPLTRLPLPVRKFMMSRIPKSLKLKAPHLKQENIRKAYAKITGKEKTPEMQNLFDMLQSDFTVVNDFPAFYEGNTLPPDFKVTGPLFSPSEPTEDIDVKILERLDPAKNMFRIFCTLGSSGGQQSLLEAVAALTQHADEEWSSVVLCPPSVCPLQEAQKAAGDFKNIYITDHFVPALAVNAMADLILCHGGQGTVQTAVASGTPIVGFAVQPEQQVNLDHIVMRGAAVRIPVQQWNAENIQLAIHKVKDDPSYKTNMELLREMQKQLNGKKEAARTIWAEVKKRQLF